MAERSSGSATRPSLLLRIRKPDDAEAWETFVRVYGPLIYRHCRGRGLQDADAAEVTQEVLLQVSRSIRRFDYRPDYGRFRDWLGTLTRQRINRFLKRKAGRIEAQADSLDAAGIEDIAAPEHDTQWTEEFQAHILKTALVRVRPHFEEHTWQAFQGVWLEGQSATDVAAALGQKLEWVYMAKSRVLKRLREEVQVLAEDNAWLVRRGPDGPVSDP
jgi:RNA polymerase sigma-70 factor (ECF subfamily)